MKTKPILFAVSLLGGLLLTGCGEAGVEEKKAPLRTVKSMTVIGGDGIFEQRFSGRLHSTSEVSYSFKVAGTIESLPVKKGQRVAKGTVIATLEAADYELQVEKAEAALAESQATLRNARADYERVKRLYKEGNTSRNALDNARASSDTAAAGVRASSKALEIAERDLSYTVLKAEGNCAIGAVDPDVGENVNSGTEIIFATCGDKLKVKLNIPESVISFIESDMAAKVQFPAIGERLFAAVVTEVGVSSVGSSTTFPVDVLITDADQSGLKPGLSADVLFPLNATRNGETPAIVVPPFAVGEDESGRFVYVIEPGEDNTATVKRTDVAVGNALQSGVEITAGLEAGMRIVTAGVSVLRDGMQVRYRDE